MRSRCGASKWHASLRLLSSWTRPLSPSRFQEAARRKREKGKQHTPREGTRKRKKVSGSGGGIIENAIALPERRAHSDTFRGLLAQLKSDAGTSASSIALLVARRVETSRKLYVSRYKRTMKTTYHTVNVDQYLNIS